MFEYIEPNDVGIVYLDPETGEERTFSCDSDVYDNDDISDLI